MTAAELALVRSLGAAVAALRERAEQADRAWEAECERADRAEQRMETAEAGRDAERTRADALQAELAMARTNAQASDQARIAAEHAHAEASVSLVALSEQLETFEAEAAAQRSRTLLVRLLAAWKGE
jgi:hypothetical protein